MTLTQVNLYYIKIKTCFLQKTMGYFNQILNNVSFLVKEMNIINVHKMFAI